MKALIADDSRVERRLISGILREQCDIGEVLEAEDGAQALNLSQSPDIDLILLDWNMPKMQGIDVLKAIRAMGNRTPVIMVTSEMEKARIIEAIGAGANNYIIKPFRVDLLVDKVKKTLSHSQELAARPHTRKALVADDSKVSRKLLGGMLRDHCNFEEILEASDGAEAVNAIKEGDFDVILLDWDMPKVQGIDVLRAIRATDRKTPVIMVTSDEGGARVIEAFDAGANNYIIKPFEPTTLAEKINHVLRIHG